MLHGIANDVFIVPTVSEKAAFITHEENYCRAQLAIIASADLPTWGCAYYGGRTLLILNGELLR